jgi:ketosteroid isomerase-like protein
MKPQITLTSSKMVVAGDIALMSNRWRMTLAGGGNEQAGFDGVSTEVARRQPDGGWLYVIDNPALATISGP